MSNKHIKAKICIEKDISGEYAWKFEFIGEGCLFVRLKTFIDESKAYEDAYEWAEYLDITIVKNEN